jgi:hypothetical protein
MCSCLSPHHERSSCPGAGIVARRGSMYAGLYGPEPTAAPRSLERVRFLDPDYAGDDPSCRRFAQLEID